MSTDPSETLYGAEEWRIFAMLYGTALFGALVIRWTYIPIDTVMRWLQSPPRLLRWYFRIYRTLRPRVFTRSYIWFSGIVARVVGMLFLAVGLYFGVSYTVLWFFLL